MCRNAKGRANLVNRDFNGVGAFKPPDAKTMGRWGFALGPEGSRKDSGASSGDRLTDQRQFDGRRTSSLDRREEAGRRVRRRVGRPGIVARCQKARIEFDPGWQTAGACGRVPWHSRF
jgi:hypothetical protein